MVTDFKRPIYCPYCGSVLPNIQERSSLEDVPYEECKSCGECFVVFTTTDVKKGLEEILRTGIRKSIEEIPSNDLKKLVEDTLPSK